MEPPQGDHEEPMTQQEVPIGDLGKLSEEAPMKTESYDSASAHERAYAVSNNNNKTEHVENLHDWLEKRLRADRVAISLELENCHSALLSDCAQWCGDSSEKHTHAQPTALRALTAPSTCSHAASSRSSGIHSSPEVQEHVKTGRISGGWSDYVDIGNSGDTLFDAEVGTASSGLELAGNNSRNLEDSPLFGGVVSQRSKRSEISKDHSIAKLHDISQMISNDRSRKGDIFDVRILPAETSWIRRVATSHFFEMTFGFLIVVSAVTMGLECQYHSYSYGHGVGYPGFTETSRETFPGVEPVFDILDVVLGLFFVMEVSIKLLAFRQSFFRDGWNIFDAVITVAWSFDVLFNMFELPINPSLLRIARSARLLRLMKVLKALASLDHLFIMTTTLRASMGLLFWAVVLMLVVQTMFAFLVNQIVVSHFHDGQANAGPEIQIEVFKYFGTFSRAMFSMFEITLGNWGPVARILVEHVNEWFMLFTLFHKLTIGFAVLGIVNGIFIQETFKVAACDDHVLLLQKERESRWLRRKMTALFNLADTSNDGRVDEDELRIILGNDQIKKWLATQGFATSGTYISRFCKLVCANKPDLSLEDFLEGVDRLKGGARSIDLALLSCQHIEFERQVLRLFDNAQFERQTLAGSNAQGGNCPGRGSRELANNGGDYSAVSPDGSSKHKQVTFCPQPPQEAPATWTLAEPPILLPAKLEDDESPAHVTPHWAHSSSHERLAMPGFVLS